MKTSREYGSEEEDRFLNLVTFKWLMAGAGWWVDVMRLQRDRAYADECLQRALRTGSEVLRQYSIELLGIRAGSNASRDNVHRIGLSFQ